MKAPKITRITFRPDADVLAMLNKAKAQPGVIVSKIINHLLRVAGTDFFKKRDR